jgi:hypothetical protein
MAKYTAGGPMEKFIRAMMNNFALTEHNMVCKMLEQLDTYYRERLDTQSQELSVLSDQFNELVKVVDSTNTKLIAAGLFKEES